MNTKKLVIYVEDIHCASCSQIITDSLSKMGGVSSVNVYLVSKIVSLEYDSDAVTAKKIIDRIKALGYTPSIQIEEDVLNESFYDKKNKHESTVHVYFLQVLGFVLHTVNDYNFEIASTMLSLPTTGGRHTPSLQRYIVGRESFDTY